MMHIKINYGRAVTTVPAVDPAILARATAEDLRILIGLCSAGATVTGETMDAFCASFGQSVGCTPAAVASSVAFWRGTGVLDILEGDTHAHPMPPAARPVEESAAPEEPRVTVRRAHDQLPSYNQTMLGDLLEKDPEIKENIDECGRIWGNLLNLQEVNVLLGLSDYLGLDWDYILSLIARCVEDMDRLGMKHSMRYVEKQAIRFYDEGVTTLEALIEKFRALDELRSAEGKLRRLFGMGERKLTAAETRYFSTWLHDYHFDYEIIELAYSIAVDTKGSPDKRYINAILGNWNTDNLRTPAAIEASMAAHRAEQERRRAASGKKSAPVPSPSGGGSFDTDSFFDAAVRRSLGDDFDPETT